MYGLAHCITLIRANHICREISFNLGRADTLGMDEYHNRKIPVTTASEFTIIPCMITFSQIIRKVSIQIYSSRLPWQEKLQNASQIQEVLDAWIESLGPEIKPDTTIEGSLSHLALREPKWCRRQRLTIRLRT
jgi:hypothetical protein